MGCFTVSRSKKKRVESVPPIKHNMVPTALPEPHIPSRSLQSAPPSFITRTKCTEPMATSRTLSAPSSFKNTGHETLQYIEYEEHDRGRFQQPPSPKPLPLPSSASFKSGNGNYPPLTLPGPLPLPPFSPLRQFSYEDIANACQNFSPRQCLSDAPSSMIFKASFWDNSLKIKATVTRLTSYPTGVKDFVKEMNTLAALQHPNLCKLLGFYAREGSDQRMVVYERLNHGSLDRLLYGRSDALLLDWNSRIRVALCAAKGLAFLHEEGPCQAMYDEFSTVKIQIERDFSAKLSGYGCVNHNAMGRGSLTPKSNVWSFGIVLLELLTGRRNHDVRSPKEERDLVKWTRPFLVDNSRLFLITDPLLKGRFPVKAVRAVSDLAQRCLQPDPFQRPTMRLVVEQLGLIQDLKHAYPLQEPGLVPGRQVAKSPSFNRTVIPTRRLSFSQSPSRPRPSISRRLPSVLSPPGCSLEEPDRYGIRKSQSATLRRASVEGF